MGMPDVRILQVEKDELNPGTARHLAKLLTEIIANPATARECNGRFVITFPGSDADARPTWAIPEVREFIKTFDEACPSALYFLNPDLAINHIQFFLLCLVKVQQIDDQWGYTLGELLVAFSQRIERVGALCQELGVDPDPVVNALLLNLPPAALLEDAALARQALRALRPTLEVMQRDFHNFAIRPEGRAVMKDVVGRAAALCGIETIPKVDETLLKKVLARIP